MGMSDLGWDNPNNALLGAVPSSFGTQMARATGGLKDPHRGSRERGDTEAMMGRLMLARMKTLEEGFAEVVKEFRGLRTAGNSSVEGPEYVDPPLPGHKQGKGKGREKVGKKKGGRGALARTTSEVDFAKVQEQVRGNDQENLNPLDEQKVQVQHDDTQENFGLERFETRGSSL